MIFPTTYSAPIGQDRDCVRPADRPAGATVNESRVLIALGFSMFGSLTWAMPTSSDAGLFTELPAGSPWSERRTHNFASRAWTWPTVSPADSASAFSCIPAGGLRRGPPESMPDRLHRFPAAESVTVGAINLHAKRWKLRPVFTTPVRPAVVPDASSRRRPARIPAG